MANINVGTKVESVIGTGILFSVGLSCLWIDHSFSMKNYTGIAGMFLLVFASFFTIRFIISRSIVEEFEDRIKRREEEHKDTIEEYKIRSNDLHEMIELFKERYEYEKDLNGGTQNGGTRKDFHFTNQSKEKKSVEDASV